MTLVAHANRQLGGIVAQGGFELHEDVLGGVALVAMLDRIDDAFADGHADPVDGIVVEADTAAQVVVHHLHEVEHLEGAGELQPD